MDTSLNSVILSQKNKTLFANQSLVCHFLYVVRNWTGYRPIPRYTQRHCEFDEMIGKKTFEPTASCSVVSVGGAVTASVTTPVAVSLKEVSGGVPRVSLVSFSMSTESERDSMVCLMTPADSQ